MKTFDEAFTQVLAHANANPDLAHANMADSISYADNKLFKNQIRLIVREMLEEINTNEESLTHTILCTGLHGMFQLGVLTGMEMERSE